MRKNVEEFLSAHIVPVSRVHRVWAAADRAGLSRTSDQGGRSDFVGRCQARDSGGRGEGRLVEGSTRQHRCTRCQAGAC